MGIWNSLFSSAEVVNKTVDGIYNGIDKSVYTTEEKAEMDKKVLDWKLDFLKAQGDQSLARRFIAIMLIGVFCLYCIVMLIMFLFVCYMSYKANGLQGLLDGMKLMKEFAADTLTLPVSAVLGFYFLTQTVGAFKK